jgi:CheY-like chemotaxis protein
MANIDTREQRISVLAGKRVLVVEDEPIIAGDYHFRLTKVGAVPAAFRGTSQAALGYLATHDVDVAIIDYRVSDGTTQPVMNLLAARAIPFIIISACTHELPSQSAAAEVLAKPVKPSDFYRALSHAVQLREGLSSA